MKTDVVAVTAPPSLDLVVCEAGFALLAGRIAGRFRRVEPRRHASALVRALIAELPRVNCSTLAEHAGHASPDAFLTATVTDRPGLPADTDRVQLTRNEITHLLAALTLSIPHPPEHRWAWSTWRRRHQFRRQQCHSQRREACWT
ncbi:hypothetical protein [Streptomyces europaeiscabiei]|uniref:hypothetical protein n=1 Tax=Streptomyces europaeiscabiei TaxID=146819 RepID=UPI003990886F